MEQVALSPFLLIVLFLAVGGTALWIYALIDAIRTPDERFESGNQLIWVLVILIANVIGALIYLVVGKPRRA